MNTSHRLVRPEPRSPETKTIWGVPSPAASRRSCRMLISRRRVMLTGSDAVRGVCGSTASATAPMNA